MECTQRLSPSSVSRCMLDIPIRLLSGGPAKPPGGKAAEGLDSVEQEAAQPAAQEAQTQAEGATSAPGVDDMKAHDPEMLAEALAEKIQEVEQYKERLARALADMENMRERTMRQADKEKQFAIAKFAVGLLDVVDNLERAIQSVPEEVLKEGKDPETGKPITADRALTILRSFVDGIKLTYSILVKYLEANGVEKIDPTLGEKLDPNKHEAVYQVSDPTKEPGTIAAVLKKGYSLNGRVLRPAEVGAVRKPTVSA
ncbi:g8206 [Coccomyxa elongata]